jgi:hypothetical protein
MYQHIAAVNPPLRLPFVHPGSTRGCPSRLKGRSLPRNRRESGECRLTKKRSGPFTLESTSYGPATR